MSKPNYCYDYPRPALTTDCVLFGFSSTELQVLLIERADEPFKGKWALPGGFMDMYETVEQCVARELGEETGLKGIQLAQLKTFSKIDRDPRGRTVSVIFYGLVYQDSVAPKAGDDAKKVSWFSMNSLPPLAFDHDEVLLAAKSQLRYDILNQQHCQAPFYSKFKTGELNIIFKLIE